MDYRNGMEWITEMSNWEIEWITEVSNWEMEWITEMEWNGLQK